jgi:hypothetical protein
MLGNAGRSTHSTRFLRPVAASEVAHSRSRNERSFMAFLHPTELYQILNTVQINRRSLRYAQAVKRPRRDFCFVLHCVIRCLRTHQKNYPEGKRNLGPEVGCQISRNVVRDSCFALYCVRGCLRAHQKKLFGR